MIHPSIFYIYSIIYVRINLIIPTSCKAEALSPHQGRSIGGGFSLEVGRGALRQRGEFLGALLFLRFFAPDHTKEAITAPFLQYSLHH